MDFENIYDEYVSSVYVYLKLRLKDQHLVEDITQDVFLDVYNSIHKLDQIKNLKAYILKITHNKMVDKLRKEKNTALLKDEMLNKESIELESDLVALNLLKNLAEDERLIIYNIYIAGLHVKDVAKILNIPKGTVKSKCYYARKKLKRILDEEG